MQNKEQSHIQDKSAYINIRKKDYFQTLYDFFDDNNIKKVIDVGAATGDFSYFGPENIDYLSTDISRELINIAEETRSKSNIKFLVDDILDTKIKDRFEAVLMLGTITTFQDVGSVLKKLCDLSDKYLIIHAPINTYNFDSLISHKNSNEKDDAYQNSFNIFSIKTIERELLKNNFTINKKERIVMKNVLNKVENPEKVTSYHVDIDNQKYLINQLGLILDEHIIIAKRIN